MKKITNILKQALRKSAMSLQEDRRLLQEQNNSGGDYGQQITNTIDQNGQCYTPIVKKCAIMTNGQPSPDTNCRYYPLRCLTDPQGNPYQIGECFSWANNDFIECVVGYTNFLRTTLARNPHNCPSCSTDIDGDGHPDCIDCSDETFTSDIPGCLDCPNCSNYGGNLTPPVNLDDGSCLGCTDPNFANYEPNADIDDGSCQNPPPTPNFDCISGLCEENIAGTGVHATLNDCLMSQDCDRWECKTSADPGAMEEQIAPQPTISNCVKCDVNRYNVASGDWDQSCQYFDQQECDEECNPPPIEVPLNCGNDPEQACWVCHSTPGSQVPPSSCIQLSNLPLNWWSQFGIPQGFNAYVDEANCLAAGTGCIDTTSPVEKDIECMQCDSGGAPVANMFPGPLCPAGWTPAQQFNPSSCKQPAKIAKMIEPTKDVRDIEVPLNEGLQLKGKLLNTSRMTKLANIKKK